MTTITINPHQYDCFIGLDVHSKSYSVTYKKHNSMKLKSFTTTSNPSKVTDYFKKHCPEDRLVFVYEAGPTGYALHDHLTKNNQRCIITHPGNVEKAAKDRVKTDRLDSVRLAESLSSGQIRGIRVPEDIYRQLRHICSSRQQYAGSIRRAKQRIESMLLFESISIPTPEQSRWSRQHIQILKELQLDHVRRVKLDSYLDDLEYAKHKLLFFHKQLREFYRDNPSIHYNIQLLRGIPGFGFVVSAYFLSRIGNPEHLRSIRSIGSFSGVVPSEFSSGKKIRKGNITHMGDPVLRSLLIEAAWATIRKDKELKQFFNRIKTKNRGDKGSRIAIVAVARKLTHRAHCVLKNKRPYIVL